MKTILTKSGFVYNGKLIPWEIFYEVLGNGISDQKTMEKIKKKIRDAIDFVPISIEQNCNLQETATILGLKPVDNDRTLKTNILKKIAKYDNS